MSTVRLSVVIPAFNEEHRIAPTLEKVRSYLSRQNYQYEVIVSDDGSTDGTISKVETIIKDWPELKVIDGKINQGKGAAVQRGVMASSGEWVLFMDADNSTPIEEIDKLWSWASDYKIIFGSRYLKGATIHIKQSVTRIFLSRLSNILIRFLAVPDVYDTQCGFKLFEYSAAQEIFKRLTIHRFGFDIELLAIARVLGYPYKEVGVDWYDDTDSRVRAGRDTIRTFTELIKISFNLNTGRYS